ncbi:MAG: non-ribosomal peptide synthetase, partial [bacterium]|nr:non-ribosomal peptide synthetase [bacterium]
THPIEKQIAAIWAEILDIKQDKIGIDQNFFQLGGHSLKVTSLISKIRTETGVQIPFGEIFKTPNIRELARYIKKTGRGKYRTVEAAEKRDYYPLSTAQRGIYIQQQKDTGITAYNMPQVVTLHFEVDRERLEEAFKKMLERHDSFRTAFELREGEPVQRVREAAHLKFRVDYFTPATPAAININDHIRPFDLLQPPLLRVTLVKEDEKKYLLIVDTHHIITDGVSMEILKKDFIALYNRESLPSLPLQYRDYSLWKNSKEEKSVMEAQRKYWLAIYTGHIPTLEIPLDFKRPPVKDFSGGSYAFTIENHLTGQLNRLAGQTGTTLYMVMLTAYYIMLSRYSGQEDFVVGSPVTGRRHRELQGIIGMFINMLAIRNRPGKNKTLGQFLGEVKHAVIDSLENQDYHFEELVRELGKQGDPGRNPLFDVVFAMQNMGNTDSEETHPTEQQNPEEQAAAGFTFNVSRFDMTLFAMERNGRINMNIEYSTVLFRKERIENMAGHYKEVLNRMVETLDSTAELKLKDIELSHGLLTTQTNFSDEDDQLFDF